MLRAGRILFPHRALMIWQLDFFLVANACFRISCVPSLEGVWYLSNHGWEVASSVDRLKGSR